MWRIFWYPTLACWSKVKPHGSPRSFLIAQSLKDRAHLSTFKIFIFEKSYQLFFPKPLTRPLLLKQCLPLGSADQGTGPQLNLPRESVLSGASLCSPQWLRNRMQPAVVKVSFFHIYILARNDYFIDTCHKNLIKIDTLNMKIDWVFMKIWINNKI